ncbi:MAG: PilZ domain-containing protein [Thiogranum sp.]|nr:PilZ domain-containing protein [Thiogranum sp.]
MAKLVLAFKDRKLKIFALTSGECLIGRDPDCSIAIDSLAVEPRHARIRDAGEHFMVESIDAKSPVLVNDQPISEPQRLQEGDQIRIGKHTLHFSQENEGTVIDATTFTHKRVGWLQIQNGSHLGRTIRLDKAFTRIGRPDRQLAIIARRDNGHYVSHLQGEGTPRLNDEDIGDRTVRLTHGDCIEVGELKVQFFADARDTTPVEKAPAESGQQRRFSRIPFDVPVTLELDGQTWQTGLVDVSLHGALIRIPAAFEPDSDRRYQLTIHLEGGPDIRMTVSIAHHENDELGLRCDDIDLDSITCLRRLVELNLGDPALLERELSALG